MTDEQWYEIKKFYRTELITANVVRETNACVFTAGRYGGSTEHRNNKQSEYLEFVKGWDNAHARAMEIAKKRVDAKRHELNRVQSDYDAIKNMSRPVIRREKD